jgi:signal transduction histidine kinase
VFALDRTSLWIGSRLARCSGGLAPDEKTEAVAQLTGGLAHHLSNVLTGIIGAIAIVRRRLANGRTDDIPHFMDAAAGATHKAAALTHRLLAFAHGSRSTSVLTTSTR